MKSTWLDGGAEAAIDRYARDKIGRDLALRLYTTRLLGREPELVLHGGGNTSVKTTMPDLLGENVEIALKQSWNVVGHGCLPKASSSFQKISSPGAWQVQSGRRAWRFSSGERCFQAAFGVAKFFRAHAANFVGCWPATLLASAIASHESEPRYVCASK